MTTESRCREAAKRLGTLDFVRIYSDDDADGISAAGVMTRALDRAGIPFHLTLERLDQADYARLDAHENVLLMDQGASELDRLAQHTGEVIVLDHHVVQGRARNVLHVNPNREGEDGTDDCCTATLALLTALHMDPSNADLAPIAMAGVIGDRQHIPRLSGSNASMAQRMINSGTLDAERGLPFRPEVPLEEAITRSVDPFLQGLTGSASKAHGFLEQLGIQPETPASALTNDEEKRVASALVAHLLACGMEPRLAEDVVGTRYSATMFGGTVTAAQLSAILNACAREERPGLGAAIAHGDNGAFREGQRLVDAYHEDVLKGLLQLERNPPEQREAIQVFDAIDPDLMGTHCGIGMAYIFAQDKPAFGLKVSGDRIKVSGRATGRLVDAGVNLANALDLAASEHGGGGGGHPIAAGAAIPADERDGFLKRLDEIIGGQLHATS